MSLLYQTRNELHETSLIFRGTLKIYCDNGTGQINYENSLATVSYAGQRFYSYTSNVLDTGTYLFAIKAEDSAGVQSLPVQIRIQVSNVTSEMVTILETQVT